MLKNQILNAAKPSELFGSMVDEQELDACAQNLKNLFSQSDPDRTQALTKIENFLQQRKFDTAKPIEGGLKVRKSPYIVKEKESNKDNIITHVALDKRGAERRFIFSANSNRNNILLQANDNIETIRASVTKRNRVNFPEIVDVFFLQNRTGAKVLATIHDQGCGEALSTFKEGSFSDESIINIYNNMMETLRKTHDAGIIHAACFTDSWVIDNETDNVILTDWKHSTEDGQESWKLSGDIAERGLYLSKVHASSVPNRETDIRLASYALFSKTSERNSPKLRKYLKSMGDFPFDSARQVTKEFVEVARNLIEQTELEPA